MKASDKVALALGAVGTWIYIGGVDSDLWGRAALGAGMFLLALVAKKIGDYVEGAGRAGRRAPGRGVCGVDPLRVVERRVRMMQIVEYTEAVDLTMHGMHDDIYVMHPVAISSMTMQDVRAAAEAGAVFAVMKQPQKEPETKEEVKPTPPRKALLDRAGKGSWTLER